MTLRTRLALAFLFLAVVPLTGVTLYSYVSTRRAFQQAVRAEAGALADEMGSRMEAVTADLGRRIERLGDLPLAGLLSSQEPSDAVLGQLQAEMGDAAALVESLEVDPVQPSPPTGGPTPPVPHRGSRRARIVNVPKPPLPPAPGAVPSWPVPSRRRWVLERDGEPPPATSDDQPEREDPKAADEKPGEAGEAFGREMAERAEELGKDIERSVEAALRARDLGGARESAARARRSAAEAREQARQRAEADRHQADQSRQAARGASEAMRDDAERMKQANLLGRHFDLTVRRDGAPVANLHAHVRAEQILKSVLSRTGRRQGEVPFALDREGHLYTPDPADATRLQGLSLPSLARDSGTIALDDWMIVTRKDPDSGLVLGIARPVGDALKEIRRTAARNLAWGLGLVGIALLGIIPVSQRMTRDLAVLTEGAERLASGDLDARVPVRSRDEFGRLADQFNRMAQDLRANQDRLLEQERFRKELEIGRRIQEELLPRDPLRFRLAEVKGVSIPAREVGGDFFNYFVLPEGDVALLVGDVSGKGVPAALLMANLQATLRARLGVQEDLAALASALDREIDGSTPPEAYVTLFMGVLDGSQRHLRYVNAGHNTQFVVRAEGGLEPLESTGRPLGLYPGGGYEERRVALATGDCLFLFTDGLVEAEDAAGEPFGEERLPALLGREKEHGLDDILTRVEAAVREHRGAAEAADDATMVVLKIGAEGTSNVT